MKNYTVSASTRDNTGKRGTKDIRKEGRVPGVIYTKGDVQHISFNAKELRPVVYTSESYIINVDVDGTATPTIIRNVDFHPVTEKMTHIELLAVNDKDAVSLTLPMRMVGAPVGVGKGGKLTVKLRKLNVKGIPTELPAQVEVNVSKLDLGQTIKVKDVDFGDIQVLTSPNAGIASVEIPRALRSATAAKAAT